MRSPALPPSPLAALQIPPLPPTPAHQIVDAQLLQLQHHRAQVGAQDLWVRLLLQVLLEAGLGVEAEALAWPRAPCPPRPLMG